VFGLGLDDPFDEPARRRGFEEEGGGAHYPAGFSERELRAIAIFALIHQPILPL
jgi:hypothetical protein